MHTSQINKNNELPSFLIEDIFSTFENWPTEDVVIRLVQEEVKKYKEFTQKKKENKGNQHTEENDEEKNKQYRLGLIMLYCKEASTIQNPKTRLLCNAVFNATLLTAVHPIFSVDTLMIAQQKYDFHLYLKTKINAIQIKMRDEENNNSIFFKLQIAGYLFLENIIEEAPTTATLQDLFPHDVFTKPISIEDVNNNAPFYLQEVLVEDLAALTGKINEVDIDECHELNFRKCTLTLQQVESLYHAIVTMKLNSDLFPDVRRSSFNSKKEIFNGALQSLGIKAHHLTINSDDSYDFSIRQKGIDKIQNLLDAEKAAFLLQKGIFAATPMVSHIKIIEDKNGEPALALEPPPDIDPYYFYHWKMNQIQQVFNISKKEQAVSMNELKDCFNIIPLKILRRLIASHDLKNHKKERINHLSFVSIEKDPIAHPLVQDIMFHLQSKSDNCPTYGTTNRYYFLDKFSKKYGDKYTEGCQNGKIFWQLLLDHCENSLNNFVLSSNQQIFYRAICNYRRILKIWPEILTMHELFVAQEKLEFMSFFQQGAHFQAEANVFTSYYQEHAKDFSLVLKKTLPIHGEELVLPSGEAKNDLCKQITDSDIHTTLKNIIEKGSLFLATTIYAKVGKKKIAASTLEDALESNEQLKLQTTRAFLNSENKTLETEAETFLFKKEQREISCLRGEVERQFSKEYGLYYKRLFITVDLQREQLIQKIENVFKEALEQRWPLNTIKTELNHIADEAQIHHKNSSGTRLLGFLANRTCGFKIAMNKVLAKFPQMDEVATEIKKKRYS